MPTYVSANRKEFRVPDEGLYRAVCKDVVELGEQETPWGKKEFIELRWDLEEVNPETAKPFEVRARYNRSLNEKSNLYKTLVLWRGRKFTAEELKKFDLDTLIGVNCQLQIVHNLDAEGRTWANVQAVIKAPKGVPGLAVSKDYVKVRDRAVEHGVTPANGFASDDDDGVPF
jgi:hypothetical protein